MTNRKPYSLSLGFYCLTYCNIRPHSATRMSYLMYYETKDIRELL